MPTLTDQRLIVNGLPIRALRGGRGPLAVCLHGFGVTADMWRPNLPALVEAGCSVLAIDLPGHGGSFQPRQPYHLSDLARVVRNLLTALGVDRLSLIGNSLGGAVASEFALAHPDRVERMVLVDALGLDPAIPSLWRARYWTDLVLPTMMLMAFGPRRWPLRRIGRITFQRPERVSPGTFVITYPGGWWQNHWGRAMVGWGVFWELVTPARRRTAVRRRAELRTPTLIVWGEDDQLLPVAHAHRGQALIPDSRLCVFPHCGHAPNLEYPDEFNRLVIDFLLT